MYFVLYDRHLKSIGDTYILESWSRIKRSLDFDDLRIVGEQIPYSADPFLIAVNDRQGKLMFSGLASTPVVNEKTLKTSISLKDYLTLLNSEVVIDWSEFSGTKVSEYLNFVLQTWQNQVSVGFETINWNVSAVADLELDPELFNSVQTENVLVYDLVKNILSYYDLYSESELNIYQKTLTFFFKKCARNKVSIRLSDFGVTGIEKSFGEYNRVSIYNADYTKISEWALTTDNSVTKLPSSKDLVYPAKMRNFIASENTESGTASAVYEAVMGLAQNRYQENIDIDAQQYGSVLDLTQIDFSYIVSVYTQDGFYRDLPVGEIETNSNGRYLVRLGYRIQELTQEI